MMDYADGEGQPRPRGGGGLGGEEDDEGLLSKASQVRVAKCFSLGEFCNVYIFFNLIFMFYFSGSTKHGKWPRGSTV